MPIDYRSSRKRKPLQDTRADSYRRSLVWRWVNEGVKASDDITGDVVRSLRKRIDMPRSFPTRTHMRNYLRHTGLDPAVVQTVIDRTWSLYREWVEYAKHNTGLTT